VSTLQQAEMEFWRRVQMDEDDRCWPITGGYLDADGYGFINVAGKRQRAHRFAFFLLHGYWPSPCCLHSCDTPACCNYYHLREGTRKDNAEDRCARDRSNRTCQPRGEAHRLAKLTEGKVRELRALRRSGMTYSALATLYGVTKRAAICADKGITWGFVT